MRPVSAHARVDRGSFSFYRPGQTSFALPMCILRGCPVSHSKPTARDGGVHQKRQRRRPLKVRLSSGRRRTTPPIRLRPPSPDRSRSLVLPVFRRLVHCLSVQFWVLPILASEQTNCSFVSSFFGSLILVTPSRLAVPILSTVSSGWHTIPRRMSSQCRS